MTNHEFTPIDTPDTFEAAEPSAEVSNGQLLLLASNLDLLHTSHTKENPRNTEVMKFDLRGDGMGTVARKSELGAGLKLTSAEDRRDSSVKHTLSMEREDGGDPDQVGVHVSPDRRVAVFVNGQETKDPAEIAKVGELIGMSVSASEITPAAATEPERVMEQQQAEVAQEVQETGNDIQVDASQEVIGRRSTESLNGTEVVDNSFESAEQQTAEQITEDTQNVKEAVIAEQITKEDDTRRALTEALAAAGDVQAAQKIEQQAFEAKQAVGGAEAVSNDVLEDLGETTTNALEAAGLDAEAAIKAATAATEKAAESKNKKEAKPNQSREQQFLRDFMGGGSGEIAQNVIEMIDAANGSQSGETLKRIQEGNLNEMTPRAMGALQFLMKEGVRPNSSLWASKNPNSAEGRIASRYQSALKVVFEELLK
jgi:hypothetical protein